MNNFACSPLLCSIYLPNTLSLNGFHISVAFMTKSLFYTFEDLKWDKTIKPRKLDTINSA